MAQEERPGGQRRGRGIHQSAPRQSSLHTYRSVRVQTVNHTKLILSLGPTYALDLFILILE